MIFKALKEATKKWPLVTNIFTYTAFCTSAEFLQQTVERHGAGGELRGKPYDFKGLFRYALLGSCVLGPSLYGWYKVLDKAMPGRSTKAVVTKTLSDTLLLGVPYYTSFYACKVTFIALFA